MKGLAAALGFGKRACPGRVMAENGLFIAVASVLDRGVGKETPLGNRFGATESFNVTIFGHDDRNVRPFNPQFVNDVPLMVCGIENYSPSRDLGVLLMGEVFTPESASLIRPEWVLPKGLQAGEKRMRMRRNCTVIGQLSPLTKNLPFNFTCMADAVVSSLAMAVSTSGNTFVPTVPAKPCPWAIPFSQCGQAGNRFISIRPSVIGSEFYLGAAYRSGSERYNGGNFEI
ncbi:hypothetical protein BU17DRAFT_63692 [Hysterangium stoloniferum]|nr:hypothetical protein BU17DRAFT_63692 [Hysterangium stoloniferum]